MPMTYWDVNPKVWHTSSFTEPVAIIVALVALLLAAVVGKIIAWWNRHPLHPKQRSASN